MLAPNLRKTFGGSRKWKIISCGFKSWIIMTPDVSLNIILKTKTFCQIKFLVKLLCSFCSFHIWYFITIQSIISFPFKLSNNYCQIEQKYSMLNVMNLHKTFNLKLAFLDERFLLVLIFVFSAIHVIFLPLSKWLIVSLTSDVVTFLSGDTW